MVTADRGAVRDGAAHLLCWELHERDGSWYAWVSSIQSTGDPVRHRHHVVTLPPLGTSPYYGAWAVAW